MKDKTKKILQDHVQSHEYDIDPLDIWSGIEAKQKKKKRKGFFWIGGLGLLLVSVVTILAVQLSSDTENIVDNTPTENFENKTNVDNTSTESPVTSDATIINKSPLINKEGVGNDQASNIINSTQESGVPASEIIEKQKISSQSKINSSSTKLRSDNSSIKSLNQSYANTSISKANSTREIANNIKETGPINTPASSIDSKVTSKILDLQPDLSELEKSISEVRESMTAFSAIKKDLNLFEIDEKLLVISDSNVDSDFERNSWVDLSEEIKYAPLFTITALQSVSFFDKQVTSNLGVEQDYANARAAVEMPLEKVGTTLLLNVELTNWLTLSTGVEYQKINEQFNWEGSYIIDEDDNIIGPVPDIETLTEEDKIRIVDRDMEIFNTYTLVNVPIQLSLHHNFKSIDYGVYGRASINVWNQTEGASLDQRLYPIELASLQAQVNTQWSAGFFTEIPIFRAWKLHAAVGLKQASIQETLTTNTYNFKDLSLGLKYQF